MQYLDNGLVALNWTLPLSEMVFGFFDALKSLTQGYATLDYVLDGYRRSDLVRCDIYLDSQLVDAFSFIIPRHKAWPRATEIVITLKYVIPLKLYPVPAQAKIGNRVIARKDIRPFISPQAFPCPPMKDSIFYPADNLSSPAFRH